MVEKFVERPYQQTYAVTDGIQQQWRDVPYMTGERHKLDIYLPNDGQGPFPVIVDLYGGGLLFGDKSSHKLEPALALMPAGYAVVSVNYSLLQAAPFPTQIYEIKAALRFLRANATTYQLDMQRVALMGESSGSYLAVMTGVSATADAFEKRTFGDFPTESEQVNAIIAMYGPYEYDKFTTQFAESGITPKFSETGEADSFEGYLFNNQAPRDVPEDVIAYNPVTYFSPQMPPILAFAGTGDGVVPYQQTVDMITAAQQVLSPEKVSMTLVPEADHGPADYMTSEYTAQKAAFLKQWLS